MMAFKDYAKRFKPYHTEDILYPQPDKITKENQNLRGKLEELQVICLHYRDTPPKNENSFLIYSPSGCCKPE